MSIKIVFGGAAINPQKYQPGDDVEELFRALKKGGVSTIDTARLYAGSEELIGSAPSHVDFNIDTKIEGGFAPGTATKERVIADAIHSLSLLKIKQFDILYLHAPDTTIPFEETLDGINEVYKKGIFKRFGISNFSAAQVEEVHKIVTSKGWVVPTVYQGNYNAVARRIETEIFPTLRKFGYSFYAYSPVAGGFLTKTLEQIDAGDGRFNDVAIGGMYNKLYNKPSLRKALSEWNAIADAEGVSKVELAYRWVAFNSLLKPELGDAVIFGASSLSQVEQTSSFLSKGKLSDAAVKRIEVLWEGIKHEAPLDNLEVFGK